MQSYLSMHDLCKLKMYVSVANSQTNLQVNRQKQLTCSEPGVFGAPGAVAHFAGLVIQP